MRRRLRDPRPAIALLIGSVAARFDRPRRDADPEIEVEEAPELVASETPEPVRDRRRSPPVPRCVTSRAPGSTPSEEETQVWGELPTEPETEVAAL